MPRDTDLAGGTMSEQQQDISVTITGSIFSGDKDVLAREIRDAIDAARADSLARPIRRLGPMHPALTRDELRDELRGMRIKWTLFPED